MTIVKTSKGPLNIESVTRTAAGMDNGQTTISFFTMDGGRLYLPAAEGARMAFWLEQRAVYDSTRIPADELPY